MPLKVQDCFRELGAGLPVPEKRKGLPAPGKWKGVEVAFESLRLLSRALGGVSRSGKTKGG